MKIGWGAFHVAVHFYADRRCAMKALIDYVLGHLAELFYITLGIGLILYSCFAMRMSFQGDFPLRQDEVKTYKATPEMRKYGVCLGMAPFLYGLYLLLYPVIAKKH
jgi:hypothetical protein